MKGFQLQGVLFQDFSRLLFLLYSKAAVLMQSSIVSGNELKLFAGYQLWECS